jgi:hypothetical protein
MNPCEEYYQKHGSKITQDSERLFVEEFLYPLLGSKIENIVPQYQFIDRTLKFKKQLFPSKSIVHLMNEKTLPKKFSATVRKWLTT